MKPETLITLNNNLERLENNVSCQLVGNPEQRGTLLDHSRFCRELNSVWRITFAFANRPPLS